MHLSHITFTGADDETDISQLSALSEKAPLIEWGLLMSRQRAGQARHPSESWRRRFMEVAPEARRCAQLCGQPMLERLQEAALLTTSPLAVELRSVHERGPAYGRVQLRFDAEHTALPVVAGVVADWRQGRWSRDDGTQIELITQHKLCNWSVHALFLAAGRPTVYPPWYSIVFDETGGEGWLPRRWPEPLPGLRCGYSGALEPEDFALHVAELASQLPDNASVWIELEAGVSTADRLDLGKVTATIEALRTLTGQSPLVPGIHVPAATTVAARAVAAVAFA